MLQLARREIAERRLYLVGGMLAGFLPLLAPLLPLAASQPAAEVRETAAMMLFGFASTLCALLLGANAFGTDLAEGRLGFYFSRPLPGWGIFAAKLAAALAVVAASSILVLVPTLLVDRRLPHFSYLWGFPPVPADAAVPFVEALATWLLAVLVVLLVAHYVRTVALTRSTWRLLDLAGLVAAFLVLRRVSGALLGAWAFEALGRAQEIVLYTLPVALVVGVALQITRGRTSVRRGHRLLAISFWVLMGAALAASGVYAAWVLSAGPEELEELTVERTQPAGEWAVISGRARNRADLRPSFLYRLSDGARLQLPFAPRIYGDVDSPALFSGDGSVACWFEPLRYFQPLARELRLTLGRPAGLADAELSSALSCARLDQADLRPRATPVSVPPGGINPFRNRVTLSDDGRRVAMVVDRLLTVSELNPYRHTVSHRLPARVTTDSELFFSRSGERLFFLRRECQLHCSLEVWRLELATGELEKLFELEASWGWSRDPLDDRLLVLEGESRGDVRLSLADLASGELRRLDGPSAEPVWVAEFLADGHLLMQRYAGEVSWWFVPIGPYAYDGEWEDTDELWLADRDGTALRRLPRRAGKLRLGGQPAAGSLLVAYTPDRRRFVAPWAATPAERRFTTYMLDLESGAERLVGRDLVPVAGPALGPGAAGSRLLRRAGGRELLLLDPETLELRSVLGGG